MHGSMGANCTVYANTVLTWWSRTCTPGLTEHNAEFDDDREWWKHPFQKEKFVMD